MTPLRLKRAGQPEPLSETAAAWLLRVEKGDLSAAENRDFRTWLAVPEHARAYEDAIWGLDSLQRYAGSEELLALRHAALANNPRTQSSKTLTALLSSIVAALLVVLMSFSIRTTAPEAGPNAVLPKATEFADNRPISAAAEGAYKTAVGEQNDIVLPDGSVATLDTDSELIVSFGANERAVHLEKGQAFFEVAKGERLPFRVYAGDRQITAVGTAFNVRLENGEISVEMIEGTVNVAAVDDDLNVIQSLRPVSLEAGENLVSSTRMTTTVGIVDTDRVATWRGGTLIFHDEKLSDVVLEINRYTTAPIILGDPQLGDYRVSGVFRTNDPERFAQAMSEIFPIKVNSRANGQITLSREE